ncbi:2'-5' RNA ligase family protein [Dactylosporangium fulvum]|uniref:2'-5' RNA ligase family protein n=1 Tax=Dactylosporangium fulvum TaxID=53359 RepID=A0ABY5W6G1_9ACTN|nr:2'-5' RNA ligase family protein [Dactylosporangium fulvum]UWP83666.1 2'-5' RNA ligase family protein [Dactylosporangium fulvum]
MVASVELHLDERATRRIRVLWDLLEDIGVQTLRTPHNGRHRPHVSLIAARALDPDRVAEALTGIEVAAKLRLNFQFAGVFVGRVVFLGLAPTPDLMHHQSVVWHRLVVHGIESLPLYNPGEWVPHCTVSMRVPRPILTDGLRRCLEVLPIEATVTRAAVVDYARDIYRELP